MGRRLIPVLLERGFTVDALVREGSESKLPEGATPVFGNVLDRGTYMGAMSPDMVVVHLVGTPRPSPAKAAQFEAVDFVSARECIAAAKAARVKHFVYVSVAHPAPIMRAYVNVRVRVEHLLRDSGIPHTIIRPWYVLGPGHRWAYALIPVYALLRAIPATKDGAMRLGLVTLEQMISTLTWAVETGASTTRIVNVRHIRMHKRLKKTTA